MSNTINNVKDVGTVIAKAAAAMLADKTQFIKSIDKEPASSFGQVNGYNVGDTINISKPARFIPSSTADITSTLQDVKEEKVSLALDIRSIVPIALTSAEIQNTLALKDWMARILDPAVSSIAQNVESTCLTRAKNGFANFAGTAGSTVFNTSTMLSARTALMQDLVPQDGKLFTLLDSASMASAVDSRKGLFQSSAAIAEQYKEGYVGYADGFTYLENNLVPRHTNGADVAVTVSNSQFTIANGMASIGLANVASSATIKAGTKFTLPGVYKVHPITKATLSSLQVFTVTADVTEASGNAVTAAISPAIYYTTTDPRQNVSAAPVDTNALTILTGSASTTYTHNLAYHKKSCRFVSVPLVKPDGLDMIGQETVDGMTIRVLRGYNILTDQLIMRLDFLGGFSVVRPGWGCVLSS